MNIYVDEAGVFVVPANRGHLICCLVGLAVPSVQEADLFYDFLRVRDQWPRQAIEIKGSSLNESQIADVIDLFQARDAIAQIVAIDMAKHTDQEISGFKQAQTERVTKHLTSAHHPDIVDRLKELQRSWRGLPNQLFVQSFLMMILIRDLIQTITLYYSQRLPHELSDFHWAIDAKDRTVTQMEQTWTTLLLPILETQGLGEPLLTIREGDYSHFQRFMIEEATAEPDTKRHIEWLRQVSGNSDDAQFSGVDIRPLMEEHRRFGDSRDQLGLQLADVVASAFYRSLNGTLRAEGWKDLGRLLVARNQGTIHFIQLTTDQTQGSGMQLVAHPMADVVQNIERTARSMWLR